jgi:iron complex outermembrane receptor protein
MFGIQKYARSALLLSFMSGVLFAADEPSTTLEAIVVTAQKREENQQSVPIAVTALTSQTLEQIRYENLSSLNGIAPGVTARSVGGTQASDLTMRGVYGSGTFASDPGISLYVDGVYLSSTEGDAVDLADVERVEILRGPQGTLFGRNALAGAVNVITKEPSGKFAVRQQVSFGNLKEIRSKTSVDLPAWGDFSASVTFLHDQEEGDVGNLGAGTAWNWGPATNGKYGERIGAETLGAHDTNAVSLALKYENDFGFKVVYRGNYSHKIYTPDATGVLTFDTGPGSNAFLSGLFGGLYQGQNPAIRTPVSSTRPDAVNNWFSTPSLDRDQSHSLTMTLPINEYLSLKNLLAYRTVHIETTNQLSGLGGLLIGPGMPILPIDNDTQTDQNSLQEELQANIDTQWVKSTVGYMHYHSQTVEGGFPNSLNAPFGAGLFPGAPAFVNFVAPFVAGALDDNVSLNSDAVYLQNDVHILPKLDLELGGRYTKDKRGGLDNSPTPAGAGVSVQYDKSTPTWLAGLNYKVTEDIFTYAKVSTAYITGGQLANVPFDSERVKSYEVGIKSDLLDQKLRLNFAAYSANYTNVQVLTNPSAGCANVPGVSATASQCVVNGGNEKANGIEAEVTFIPLEGLTLAGNTAYTHVKISDVPATLKAPDGNFVLSFLPSWTASLSAQYRGPDMDMLHGAHVTGRVGGNYVSSAFGSTPNSVVAVADAAKIPGRTIVDGRLGLGGFQLASAETEVALYVKNLTNNKEIIYDFNSAANIPAIYQRAREFGIDLVANF